MSTPLPLQEALDLARTGDLWIFRGTSAVDRVMHAATNSPVNHVGMALVLDDLPPLIWHAELARSLVDHWSGDHHRGAQLHDLGAAVRQWQVKYGQRAYLRQLSPAAGTPEEDAALLTIARLNGVSFPSTARLAGRWLTGRDGYLSQRRARRERVRPETAYCAEVVAKCLVDMGILLPEAPANWYDPGRFWSGDHLPMAPGWSYAGEVAISPDPVASRTP
ncbi:MAG: hypothetical protein LCH77_07300 [Actinobacteria bacterium]|nr:hypothetical protein [Actinomycetota bacterium]